MDTERDEDSPPNGRAPRVAPVSTRDRGPAGRFAEGNTVGRLGGNPTAKRMRALRSALLDSATPEDVAAVGAKLAAMAKAGDVAAAKVWLEFLVGKAPASVEISGADGEPLGLDLSRLQGVLMEALAPFAEARVAVALKLRELARAGQPGDGA